MLNKIMLEGNLVADPETVPAGVSTVTKFRLASTRNFRAPNGDKRSKTTFIDCQAWNGVGLNLARSFKKGDPILIDGRLEFDEWVNGEKRHSRNFIDIAEFHFPRGKTARAMEEAHHAAVAPVLAAAGAVSDDGGPPH